MPLLGTQHPSKPVTPDDKSMSVRHLATRHKMDKIKEPDADDLKQSIAYNRSHRDEHDKAIKDRQKDLEKIQKKRSKLVDAIAKARS